jgi:hypothetical protein
MFEWHDTTLTVELWRAEGSEAIITTDEHPFYVMGKGFTEAAKLVLGDVIKLAGNRLSVVGDLKRNFNGQLAYNLSVAHDHTYFVGQSRAWVHNCDLPDGFFDSTDPYVTDLAKQIEAAYPGHVVGVNVPVYDSAGKLVTDADIMLRNAAIQVKGGNGAGLTRQLEITERATGLPTLGYGPNLGPSIMRSTFSTNSSQLIIDVVKP